jgi:two-component system response regulator DevR
MHEHREPSRPAEVITVVLVEDHVLLATLLTDLLMDSGIHVLASVGTRREGHRAVHTHRPHIAVIDNDLPDGSGIDLCRSLAADIPEVITLLHTGAATAAQTHAALNAGAAAVVLKTARGESLLEAIQSHAPTGH